MNEGLLDLWESTGLANFGWGEAAMFPVCLVLQNGALRRTVCVGKDCPEQKLLNPC